MHDGMQYDPIQGQGHEPLIFVLVFVSHDFEVGSK